MMKTKVYVLLLLTIFTQSVHIPFELYDQELEYKVSWFLLSTKSQAVKWYLYDIGCYMTIIILSFLIWDYSKRDKYRSVEVFACCYFILSIFDFIEYWLIYSGSFNIRVYAITGAAIVTLLMYRKEEKQC